MVFRITIDPDRPILKIDGRLAENAVRELEQACEALGERPVIDLSDLRSADNAGIRLLRALRARGATLTGARPFIEMALGELSDRVDPSIGSGQSGNR